MKNWLTQNKQLTQLLEYLISGGIYFWVGYGAFALLWSGAHWSLWWAAVTSNFIGWTVNFLMQRYWVFNNPALQRHRTEVTGRYILLTGINFVLNYFILLGLRKGFGISPYAGQFISAAFFTVWNYFWYRYWVFPKQFSTKAKISFSRAPFHLPHGRSAYN